MLPRVSAALSEFIRPIASLEKGGKQLAISKKPEQGFKRHEPEPKAAPKLAVVPEIPQTKDAEVTNTPTSSVAHTFLQLITTLNSGRTVLFRWIGIRAYMNQHKERKKLGKNRKGAMLDAKAE